MPFSRRQLLARAATLGSLAACGVIPGRARALIAQHRPPQPLSLDPDTLTPFVDPLPIPPLAVPTQPGHYRMVMQATARQLHRDLPPTTCWTYNGHLPGPTIEARSRQPITVEWANALPKRHFLPIDHSLHGASKNLPEVRAVVHLHGARVASDSDGYPTAWYVPGQSRTYRYTNGQDPALLFYHDHAMGINRLNVYAGLFGLMVLRDDFEGALSLPSGEFELPLVLCDRLLTPQGQLYYPVSPIPGKPWLPEIFGNLILVNGKILPELRVEPRAYRFRVLNAANDRFFRLSFADRHPFFVVGSDQGLLAAPVVAQQLQLAPAERSDWVVDFSRRAGESLLLRNDAMEIMRVRVAPRAHAPEWRPPAHLRPAPRTSPRSAARTRALTLDEYDDFVSYPMLMLLDGKYWHEPVSEKPELNSTEIWSFINTTPDTHPIHLHLVRFQILDRQPYDWNEFLDNHTVRITGPRRPPAPEEMGWKDTVRCDAGYVTRIIVKFEGFTGRYLWHCHVLDHEANQMMRPFEVVSEQ